MAAEAAAPDRRIADRGPDAIVIGATKAGTTSLFEYLIDHPQVFMDPQKELRFFHRVDPDAAAVDAYLERFRGAEGRVAMESSNGYTRSPVYPGVPERMAALCPDVRLVYLTRDPMARLESHYRHRLAMGREWRSPDLAIAADPSYVAASLFGHQLSLYHRHFTADRIHVVRSERLFDDADGARSELCAFLGIEFDPDRPWPRANTTMGRTVVPRPLRRLYGWSGSERLARWARGLADILPATGDAGAPTFDLGNDLRRDLESRFDADARLLADLTDTEYPTTEHPTAGGVSGVAGESSAPATHTMRPKPEPRGSS